MRVHKTLNHLILLTCAIFLLINNSFGEESTQYVRAYFPDKSTAHTILQFFEVEALEVSYEQGYVLLDVPNEDIATLKELNCLVEPCAKFNIHAKNSCTKGIPASSSYKGIPGYPSYLLVEETFHYADSLAKAFPKMAKWIDVGDSWEKTQGNGGYDHMVLILSNQDIKGPKPKLFVTGSIHAREYTTSELNRRFVKYLIENYGKDPDVTWMLDYHEFHAMFYVNPDGRKHAESGKLWRKTTNTDYCKRNPSKRGVDLNRNSSYRWSTMGVNDQCDQTYYGPRAASEPEMKALEAYQKKIFKDNPKMGFYIDLHSYGEIIYKPSAMTTIARKFTFHNGYRGYATRGGQAYEHAWYTVGTPACLFELGTTFFQKCDFFERDILPKNLPALEYALRFCRAPLDLSKGPDIVDLKISGNNLTATADDTRYGGSATTHNISEAEYYIQTPPWESGAKAISMSASDGNFNSKKEGIKATLGSLPRDNDKKALIFVRAKDAGGNWGAVSAVFYDAIPTVTPLAAPLKPVSLMYQNPLSPPAAISFELPKASKITLKVFSLDGRDVATITQSNLQKGMHTVQWDGNDNNRAPLGKGIYLFHFYVDNARQMEKFVLVK